jgi:hypothetical protein
VDDTRRMSRTQALGRLSHNLACRRIRQGTDPIDEPFEVDAVQERHGVKVNSVGSARIDRGDQVRVIELRDQSNLAFKSRQSLAVFGRMAWKHLERRSTV